MKKSVYTRPNKLFLTNVNLPQHAVGFTDGDIEKQESQVLEIDKDSECHITPDDIAAEMVDYLCPPCHEYTWYGRWLYHEDPYVVHYGAGYEPYTVLPRSAARYDEVFTGRHMNKNMHIIVFWKK